MKITLYVCDPKKHQDCKRWRWCNEGKYKYCHNTAKPECAKLDENGEPIVATVVVRGEGNGTD